MQLPPRDGSIVGAERTGSPVLPNHVPRYYFDMEKRHELMVANDDVLMSSSSMQLVELDNGDKSCIAITEIIPDYRYLILGGRETRLKFEPVLTSAGSPTPTIPAAMSRGTSGTPSFYNALNQPVSITGAGGGNYIYDGNLKRVKQVVDGEIIYSVYNKAGPLPYETQPLTAFRVRRTLTGQPSQTPAPPSSKRRGARLGYLQAHRSAP